jgi:branched-chain amino acid transport system ATP-binding protein
MTVPLLQVRGLSVSYGGAHAVRGIDLEVHLGEVVGIVGPNGAGKTSTLSAIVGLVRPASGEITFDGQPLVGRGPEWVARQGMAFVPEGRHIFQSLTVAENLWLGTTARRSPGAEAELETWLDRFPILRRCYRQPAGRLSGGEQQQLAIARALLSAPRLLLLDEPSLGLAPIMVDLVFEVLHELRERGVTVLLVEQNARRTLAFADRSYLLTLGRVALGGSRAAFEDDERVGRAYLGAGAVGP